MARRYRITLTNETTGTYTSETHDLAGASEAVHTLARQLEYIAPQERVTIEIVEVPDAPPA